MLTCKMIAEKMVSLQFDDLPLISGIHRKSFKRGLAVYC